MFCYIDTMFYIQNKNSKRADIQLQRQVILATDWFRKWRLRINEIKSIAVIFGYKCTNSVPQITINNIKISWVKQVKYLSVTFGRRLRCTRFQYCKEGFMHQRHSLPDFKQKMPYTFKKTNKYPRTLYYSHSHLRCSGLGTIPDQDLMVPIGSNSNNSDQNGYWHAQISKKRSITSVR